MGRTAKFTDELLLKAVIEYSGVIKTTIKASELARWSRKNISGLEDVKDYHFTRKVKNPISGKIEKKLCTKRIEELNVARDTRKRENKNILLSSVNIDKFFELDLRNQRKVIIEAREIVSEYKRTNINLQKQNEIIKNQNSELSKVLEMHVSDIKDIKKKQKLLNQIVNKIRKNIDDDQIKMQLEQDGIIDGKFDILKHNESLNEDINSMFNIDKAIQQYENNNNLDNDTNDDESKNSNDNLINDLLDF